MRITLAIATIVAALAFAGCEVEGTTTDASFTPPAGSDDPEPAAEAEPNVKFSLNCDYLLGDFNEGTDQGYRFVAGGEVENTGNVGAVVVVTAKWSLLGTDPVVETRRVRLRPGQGKDVQITYPATQTQIDAHQSADANCKADAAIADTFGKAQ